MQIMNQIQASDDSLEQRTLIIVHANGTHNPDYAGIANIQKLVDANIAKNIYEHQAYGYSCVKHNGIIINNDSNPAYYIIPDLKGNEFILVGGSFGDCHFAEYFALLAQKNHKTIKIHMPADCIYATTIYYDSGEDIMYNNTISANSASFKKYFILAKLIFENHSISVDQVEQELRKGHPMLHLMLWSNYKLMLNYIENEKRRELEF